MKKILFLIHKTSESSFQACVESINTLKKDPRYEINQMCWSDPDGKFQVSDIYYSICKDENPDFTIIIEDTILFIDEYILFQIMNIFSSDNSVGVIGVKGVKELSPSGIVDEAGILYGGYYSLDSKGNILERIYNNTQYKYIEVEAVSAMMLAVRGSLPIWPRVNTRCFGEIISIAAALQGLKVVVPKDAQNWCLNTSIEELPNQSERAFIKRKLDLKRYLLNTDHILLTVGIPTYNRSKYFKKCIANLYKLVGNMPWVEVFVSNNDSTDDTEEIAKQYLKYDNFRYYKQPVNIVGKNFDYLYENALGEYVVACGDDDYYYNGAIYNILEAICFGNKPTVMNLIWSPQEMDFYVKYGNSLDNFLVDCTELFTCISCIILNHERYLLVEDKEKFTHTHLNQIYVQMEMIRNNPEYAIIYGNNFADGSGEAASDRIFESRYPYCQIFIKEQYEVIDYFLDKGLSREAYEAEKIKNLKKNLRWLHDIKNAGNKCQWRIDDDLEEIIEKYYSYEPYYEDLRQEIRKILSE